MLRKALPLTILGIAILVSGQTALAQSREPASPNGLQKLSNSVNKFGKDINQFGKNLVGMVLDKDKNKKSNQKRQSEQPSLEFSSGRAGSVLNRYRTTRTDRQNTTFPAKPTPVRETYGSEESLTDQWPYQGNESSQTKTKTNTKTSQKPSKVRVFSSDSYSSHKQPSKATSNNHQSTTTTSKSLQPLNPQLPLHKRLRTLKRSPFESSYTNEATTSQVQPIEAKAIEPNQTTRRSTSSPIRMDSSGTHSKPNLQQPPNGRSPYRNTTTPSRSVPSFKDPSSKNSSFKDQVLLRRDCPVLNVQTMGPARINIGREAKYKIILENQGNVTAHEVLVTVELPQWADVVDTEAEQGTAAIDRSVSSRRICWRLESLPGNTRHEMTLRLIPRERRPIKLAIRSSFTQVASQAVIEVQEPQLSMRLIGPKQIQLGEAESFKIEISNTGNGPAEEMILTLLPLTKRGMPTTHRLGNLEAGKKRTIDLELTAQQVENVSIEADLKCTASKGTQLIEKLTVLAPNIKVGMFGPAVRFLNTRGIYQIKVANFGNLDARDIEVRTVIPQEAKFLKASKGIQFQKRTNTATWKIASLKPKQEEVFEIECEMIQQGTARLLVNVNDGRYTELSKVATIRVEAMADLAMEIVDPQGPISIGEEAVYEIHIRNQGTRPAEMVSAVDRFQ